MKLNHFNGCVNLPAQYDDDDRISVIAEDDENLLS